MKRRWSKSSRSRSATTPARGATTLVEVIAGLVILGTILSSVLIARGRFARQEAQAQRRLQATRALDELVNQWMSGPSSAIPLSGRGTLSESNQIWRTHVVPDRSAEELGTQVLRVEVFDPTERSTVLTLDLLLRTKEAS